MREAMNDAEGSFAFDAITYSEPGIHYYVICEDSSDPLPGITYDETQYRVTVIVTDIGGQLSASAAFALPDGGEAQQVVFRNTFTPSPENITVTIPIVKTVKNLGTKTLSPEGFSFLLKNLDTGAEAAAKTDTDGKAEIVLTFSEADIGKTFRYSLSETQDGRENVTYSTQVYNFQIAVALEEDNTLSAALSSDGSVTTDFSAAFENIYDASEPTTPSQPSQPTEPEQPTEPTSPDGPAGTGDSSNVGLYIALMVFSAAVVILLLLKRRRK